MQLALLASPPEIGLKQRDFGRSWTDGAAEFFGGFDPFLNDSFYVGESFFVGFSWSARPGSSETSAINASIFDQASAGGPGYAVCQISDVTASNRRLCATPSNRATAFRGLTVVRCDDSRV